RLFLFLLVRGGLFVNRATILVLHLGSLEHLVAFSLLACVFVIARLAVDFRLVEVGIEIARIGPVAHIHDESVAENQGMAYFGTGRCKKSHYHDHQKKAQSHPCRLTGAFRRVKENSTGARPPIIDREFCAITFLISLSSKDCFATVPADKHLIAPDRNLYQNLAPKILVPFLPLLLLFIQMRERVQRAASLL